MQQKHLIFSGRRFDPELLGPAAPYIIPEQNVVRKILRIPGDGPYFEIRGEWNGNRLADAAR